MKKAAIYARHIDRSNVESQIDFCKEYADQNDLVVLTTHIYTDTESSNVTTRPGFSLVLQAIREKQIDVILVENLSRISLKSIPILNFVEITEFMDIELHSVADHVNWTIDDTKMHYKLREIINGTNIDDLIRGMWGQKERGPFVCEETYGFGSVPSGAAYSHRHGRRVEG